MSIVLTRRPPTIACRRFGAAALFCCALIRLPSMLHPANITPPAAAAFLRKSLRLVMTTLQVQCTSRLTVQQLASRERNAALCFVQGGAQPEAYQLR